MADSLMDAAKKYLTEEVFPKRYVPGVTIVTASPKVDRAGLIAWIMEEFAGDPDPKDPFCAVHIASQRQVLEATHKKLHQLRLHTVGKADSLLQTLQGATPPLREFNFVRLELFLRRLDSIEPGSIDLLILDLCRADEMDKLAAFVDRIYLPPMLTVVVSRTELPPNSPWQRFGVPHIMRGLPPIPKPREGD